jgi:hypothetical protein
MWQNLSKFLTRKKESFPPWTRNYITKVQNRATMEKAAETIVDILLEKPVGHTVRFLVNGSPFYAVMDDNKCIWIHEEI